MRRNVGVRYVVQRPDLVVPEYLSCYLVQALVWVLMSLILVMQTIYLVYREDAIYAGIALCFCRHSFILFIMSLSLF